MRKAEGMHWYEDEDFWREMYPYMFPAEKFSAAEEQVSQILSLSALESGPILDLCCGPGRHATEFGLSTEGAASKAPPGPKARYLGQFLVIKLGVLLRLGK
jgi:hypothetical protein